MKLYFIRHGETEWNKQRKLQGQVDIPLNEYGRSLAKITAEGMADIPFDKVFTSPLKRAKETAQILCENRPVTPIEDMRLKEISFGVGEGKSLAAIHNQPGIKLYAFLHHPEDYVPPRNGETFIDMYRRCNSFIEEVLLPLESTCENVAVVAHGALNRGMIHYANHRPEKDFWSVTHKNCSVTIMDCTNGHLTILEEGKIYYKEEVEATW